MIAIVGLVLLFVFVFGGYVMAGGSMAPIIKAAPIETFIIVGAGIAVPPPPPMRAAKVRPLPMLFSAPVIPVPNAIVPPARAAPIPP